VPRDATSGVTMTDPTVYWQRRSLNELADLAGDIISVRP
jgi:hypothetical protein